MSSYFFILGRNPSLSVAEILSALKSLHIVVTVKTISREVLVIESQNILAIDSLMKSLGGTVKIGKIVSEVGLDQSEQEFQKIFVAENIINNFLTKLEGKIHFGISVYDGGGDKIYLNRITDNLKTLNITIKENLQEKGVKAGFVRIKERYLSSVSVWKNQLLTHGTELLLILTKDKILAGKTLAVQEFASFSFRDYGRPERDRRVGIIPPKLARIMVNLASIDTYGTILDPFCGSGTILQEAIILGYKNLTGADINNNAVDDTRKNIDWLFKNFRQLDRSSYKINIFQSDVRLITDNIKNNSIDAIVSEPYLGPPLFKMPNIEAIKKITAEVSQLYIAAFESFSKIIKKAGKIVFLFPAFEISGEVHFVPILDKIEKIGFRRLDFFPLDIAKNPAINLTNRATILYGSREHFVRREIITWEKL